MELIRNEISEVNPGKPRIGLAVDRMTLAKRRWRGVAEDGREFGFDLAQPFRDGAIFFETDSSVYIVTQKPETVLEISLGEPSQAARMGWMIGNLHFPIEVGQGVVRAPDDPAVRQLLEREHVPFTAVQKIFQPLKAEAHHHHEH